MCNAKLNAEQAANETFRLLTRALAHRNICYRPESIEKIKQFKAHRKKLYILFCIDSKKNCTLSGLEKMLMENRSTACAAVSKLYVQGLISKNQPGKGEDGRKVYFKVTKKGKSALDMLTETFIGDVKNFYETLSDEKKQDFANGILYLNRVFD